MLGVSYNERGYRGARVQVTQQDGKDVFKCVHSPAGAAVPLQERDSDGLPENAMTVVMQDAPKAGDVYSAARVND
jgi:hypothetical protein